MSKTKHPANMVPLTESKNFAHIFTLLLRWLDSQNRAILKALFIIVEMIF